MKTTWIKTSDKLPELIDISRDWKMSKQVLIYYKDCFIIGVLNYNNGETYWILGERDYPLSLVEYWQPLEEPIYD